MIYAYDRRDGSRKFFLQAFGFTWRRLLLTLLTLPLLLLRLWGYLAAGCPDDYPDITVIQPGGRLKPDIRVSNQPEASPVRLPELRVWRDVRPAWRNLFYYDTQGRVYAFDAFHGSGWRRWAWLATWPLFLWRLLWMQHAGMPDDYPDPTVVHPGGGLKSDIRVVEEPQAEPGRALRLWKDGARWKNGGAKKAK